MGSLRNSRDVKESTIEKSASATTGLRRASSDAAKTNVSATVGGNEITGDGKDFWTEEEKRNAVLLYLVVTPVCPPYVDDDSGKVAIAGFAANATFVQTQLDLAEPPIPAPIG